MTKLALLVIDVQTGLVDYGPYNCDVFLNNLKQLIGTCRDSNVEVIYVRHGSEVGKLLEPGCNSWQIYSEVEPFQGEMIIDKQYSSAFRKTNLKDYLNIKEINKLMVTGMQTDYCVDTTIKVAFEYGYDIVIPKMANTTFNNGSISGKDIYELYNERIFDGRFGQLVEMDDALIMIKK